MNPACSFITILASALLILKCDIIRNAVAWMLLLLAVCKKGRGNSNQIILFNLQCNGHLIKRHLIFIKQILHVLLILLTKKNKKKMPRET